jgi:hypothetical protein
MATIGWIKIGVATDTSQFDHAMKHASSVVQEFKHEMLAMGTELAGAYLGIEGVRGIYEWIKGSGEAINQARILGDRVGVSSEAFNKLSYAAKVAGLDQDGLAVSIEQMNKRLGELAVEGKGPAADAIKRFSLNARQLAELGPEKSFEKLVGVLSQIQNPAERAAVAMDLFGKSGQQILNLAKEGPGGLRELGEQAEKLGIATNNVDAEKIHEAEHAWTQIWTAAEGLGRTIAIEVAPYVAALADSFTDWIKTSNGFASIKDAIHDYIITPIGAVIDIGTAVKSIFVSMAAAGVHAFGVLLEFPGQFSEEWAKSAQKYKDMAASMYAQGQEIWESIGQTFKGIEEKSTASAQVAAAASAKFRAPGALSPLEPKVAATRPEHMFAGAFTLGSREAYSAILTSRGVSASQTDQKAIRDNTKEIANAAREQVALLTRVAEGGLRAGANMATNLHAF